MGHRFRRPCLVCGKLAFGSRCEIHQALMNQALEAKRDTPERRLKKKLLYGGTYQARRRAALQGATHCYICKQPFQPGEAIDADHLDAGNPASPLAATHATCNRSRGNKPL